MAKLILLFLLCLFFCNLPLVSALCGEEQIDINSASAVELEDLNGIGPVKAEAIINTRPFEFVDELINVYGIGPVTLEKIKTQGLACVENETEEEEITEENLVEKEIVDEGVPSKGGKEKEAEVKTIDLTAKTIKSQENTEDKSNYAVYGFVAFCILLGFLFMIKYKRYKNEFR